ncbi:hypothetical protein MTO96_038324, partial [Rhipicephalus appendiculatus]
TCVIALCCDWFIIVREPGRGESAARQRPLSSEPALAQVVIQWPSCRSRASLPRSGRLPAAGRTQGRRASSHASSLSPRLRTATDEDRAAECGYLDDSGLRGSTEILCDRPAMENAATDAAGNAARPRTVAVRCWTVAEADLRSQGARLPDPPEVQVCGLCGLAVYFRSHYEGALHVAKKKVTRENGRH